ncbi:MAG: hypothetical protein D6718_02080 [Acidobacteria bacterium]|nr:MAG: hypothetical protein D6718_02080 [Acidobacteriota bacterium]
MPRRREPRGERGKERGGSPLRTVAVVGAILAAGVAGQLVWGGLRSPDPHYLEARRLIAEYELGKPPELINYNHPVYGKALAELELVDPDSPSAAAAGELAAEIRHKIEEFRARMAAEARRKAREAKRRREREAMFLEAQERARLNPVTSYPECENEGQSRTRRGR